MHIEQIYTGCLAQGAYYISSNGEAAIIDPLREVQPYLDRLHKDGVRLKYIFETHFHADFVSGHVDLARQTGATIVYGPKAYADFDYVSAPDGAAFSIGTLKVVVLHTPGHTLESTCFLLRDESGRDHALFTGDTLFLGDVGRPDLAQKAASMTQEELAGLLYDSITRKILPLADDVIVYPAHGAGSACGKNMMKETVDTLGNQKRVNYALHQPDRASFIRAVTEGLTPPPRYFAHNVAMNRQGYTAFTEVLCRGLRPLAPDAFEATAGEAAALIIDTRPASDFATGFIPQSVNIGLSGDFAPWVGALVVDVQQPILLVTEPGTEEEAVTRLSRVGFDQVLGYLEGGFPAWMASGKEADIVHRISAEQLLRELDLKQDLVIDVRREGEYAAGHLEQAASRPLAYINEWMREIDPERHFYLHCAGGYRSMIAASILQARGYRNFSEVAGGFDALRTTGLPCTESACQRTVS